MPSSRAHSVFQTRYPKQKIDFSGGAPHLGRLEGVVWSEGDVEKEDSSLVHGARRTQDRGPPLVDVVSLWAGTEKHTMLR